MIKRQRGPKIKPSLKKLISGQAIRYPEKPREALAAELKDTIERMGEVTPADETLLRMISDARNKITSPLDNNWQIILKDDIPIPAEAIPYILKVKAKGVMLANHFTIRHALWVSRLYTTIKDVDTLARLAWYYALDEKLCELAGTDFDTTGYDELLLDPPALINKFEKQQHIAAWNNFKDYKRAFEETTGVEMAGIMIDTLEFRIYGNNVYALLKQENGPDVLAPLPAVKDAGQFIDALKKQKMIKRLKKSTENVVIISLKELVAIKLDDLGIKLGVNNEGTHNKKR